MIADIYLLGTSKIEHSNWAHVANSPAKQPTPIVSIKNLNESINGILKPLLKHIMNLLKK